VTSIVVAADSDAVFIAGHGILVPEPFELSHGITICPNPPHFEIQAVADGCDTLHDYAVVLSGIGLSSFYLKVEGGNPKELVVKGWNSLWLFHLLALACQSPCDPLYAWSGSDKPHFSVPNPHTIFQAPGPPIEASRTQLEWAQAHLQSFEILMHDQAFMRALRGYANSHHLFGYDSRLMQLWSGIECLFRVSSEISRTVALYSALLLDEGDAGMRYKTFKEIRKAYDIRSKVVHGALENSNSLGQAYDYASKLLARLLARCVELSRVPSAEELERTALAGHLNTQFVPFRSG
jgi:hypothetical protein